MNQLAKYITLLHKSIEKTPQQQLELIQDISRRGFLKQVIDITVFAAFTSTCCAIPSEYSALLPDMGDSDRTAMTPAEANFLGRQVVLDIASQGEMLNDYDIIAYLNDIGSNLVSYSPMAGQDFNFYIIKDKQINAFALPGGYVCVYNGLVYCTHAEAELTAVMSHEISHVVQHHIFRNIANYNREQWKSLAGIIAGGLMTIVNPAAGMLAINSAQGLSVQNMLGFSRDFEREADRVGQKLMYNAGYDPHAMPEFFQRLKDNDKFNDNEAYAFLRTHPVTSERLSEAIERANQLKVKMRPDSVSFLLIREKCRVRQIGVIAALAFYNQSIKSKRYVSLDAQYYGLAWANYLDKKFINGLSALNRISSQPYKTHPAVLSLQAQLLFSSGNYTAANKVYLLGLDTYPTYKNLWLGQVDLYIKAPQLKLAGLRLDDLSNYYPNDGDIWSRIALVNSDTMLNNVQKYYYALGNCQYILANYKAALEQYMMAVNVKHADAVLNDVISAKIVDTREMIKSQSRYGG
ncbi:MAG: beta-barrel assembly-enhancing protease [Pseudomonadota bacterium]|nr:beta-barrel assembly-enhancing protease [Pseudomonadota bacterium]